MAVGGEGGGGGVAEDGGERLRGIGHGEDIVVDGYFLFFTATTLRALPASLGFLARLPLIRESGGRPLRAPRGLATIFCGLCGGSHDALRLEQLPWRGWRHVH